MMQITLTVSMTIALAEIMMIETMMTHTKDEEIGCWCFRDVYSDPDWIWIWIWICEYDDVSEMCGILALFGADPQANSELRAELLRWGWQSLDPVFKVILKCLLNEMFDPGSYIQLVSPVSRNFNSQHNFCPASRSCSATEAPTGTESPASATATSPTRDSPSMDFFLELRWEIGQPLIQHLRPIICNFELTFKWIEIYVQPITNINGDTALSVNGEIYNHIVSPTSHFGLRTWNLKESGAENCLLTHVMAPGADCWSILWHQELRQQLEKDLAERDTAHRVKVAIAIIAIATIAIAIIAIAIIAIAIKALFNITTAHTAHCTG